MEYRIVRCIWWYHVQKKVQISVWCFWYKKEIIKWESLNILWFPSFWNFMPHTFSSIKEAKWFLKELKECWKIVSHKKSKYEFDDTDDSDSVVYMEKSWFH